MLEPVLCYTHFQDQKNDPEIKSKHLTHMFFQIHSTSLTHPPNAHPAFQTQGTQLPSGVIYFIFEQFPLSSNSDSHIFRERQSLGVEVQKHQELQLTGSPTHIQLNVLAPLGDPWSFEVATNSTSEEIRFWTLWLTVRYPTGDYPWCVDWVGRTVCSTPGAE